MANLTSSDRVRYVQGVFNRIAPRYDLMNRLMSGGQDVFWRQEVIHKAQLPEKARLLDLGAGTGDLARTALQQRPACNPIAADFTLSMMIAGQRHTAIPLKWTAADALQLPFPSATFDAVVSGFLLRNVADLDGALAEQRRVLKPEGWLVSLDTTRPSRNWLTPLMQFYLHRVIPALGKWITGQADAYTYLPDSTELFLPAEELAERISQAGFQHTGFHKRMFGSVAIHWGQKG